jgi:Domain of unknown function (DUF5666)/Viral BACON domain/Putative binding domain, N-terminal
MVRRVFGSIVACFLSGGVLACTSSQTSTSITAPASAKCQVQVGSPTTSFTADGGRGTLSIATTRECVWSVSTSANWVSVANAGGQGEASVPYTVAANPVPVSRAADITVSDATLRLNQAAAPCQYTLSPALASIGSSGGNLTTQLTTTSGCQWSATTDATWLRIVSGASGSTSGTIAMSAASNTGAARSAHLMAAGATYTVNQAGAGSPPPPPPPPTQVSGNMSGISNVNKCPDVSFTVSSTVVTTTSATVFVTRACIDLRNGRSVSVTGVPQLDGTLLALTVDEK